MNFKTGDLVRVGTNYAIFVTNYFRPVSWNEHLGLVHFVSGSRRGWSLDSHNYKEDYIKNKCLCLGFIDQLWWAPISEIRRRSNHV